MIDKPPTCKRCGFRACGALPSRYEGLPGIVETRQIVYVRATYMIRDDAYSSWRLHFIPIGSLPMGVILCCEHSIDMIIRGNVK